MAESLDSLDFLPEVTATEKDAIPLDCWQEINLSDIWIPSNLLSNENDPSSTKVHHGIFHSLGKKDPSKYAKSFSVYSLDSTGNEEGEIFISDSDDDIFGSESNNSEKLQISDDKYPVVASNMCPPSSVCSNDLKNSTKANLLNKNLENDKTHLNLKENLIVSERNAPYLDKICQEENTKMTMNSNENLINWRDRQQNDHRFCAINISNSIHTESQKQFASMKENHVVEKGGFEDRLNNTYSGSLKDILDDTPEINLKDSKFVFKKKDDPFLLSLCDTKEIKDTKGGKKAKKNKKDKGKKKTYLVLDDFSYTNTQASQEYHCDKYFQKILKDKQKDTSYSNNFPHLPSNEHMLVYSDKREKEASYTNVHVGSNMDSPRLSSNEHMFSLSDKREKEEFYTDIGVGSNMDLPHFASNEHMFTLSGKREKEAPYTNIHVGGNTEFPHLASDEHMSIQSDKREKEASYTNIHMESNIEFPHLASDEHTFTQPNKREKQNFECSLLESKEINENINNVKEVEPYTTDVICGKIVIENIPHDTSKDDVLAILCGYGEIKEFSLVSTGNYFTAYVEIDLICDIDWIIECLNGSEPFGASTEKIYCYKQ